MKAVWCFNKRKKAHFFCSLVCKYITFVLLSWTRSFVFSIPPPLPFKGGPVGQTSRWHPIRSVDVATASCRGCCCTRQSEISGQSRRWRWEPLALRGHRGSERCDAVCVELQSLAPSMSCDFKAPFNVGVGRFSAVATTGRSVRFPRVMGDTRLLSCPVFLHH